MTPKEKILLFCAGGAILIAIIILIIWAVTRKRGSPSTKYFTCSSDGVCKRDDSGQNYPNDSKCGGECAKRIPGTKYYKCDKGQCTEDSSGNNYPNDPSCGKKCGVSLYSCKDNKCTQDPEGTWNLSQCQASCGNSPGPPVTKGLSDCLALNYWGADNGPAPLKICGVFDGFSHWSWAGMQQWLAYFSYKTGAKSVIIYEAQFIPEAWINEVGLNITNPTKGIKSQANPLPILCENNKNCQGSTTDGSDIAPGANWICKNNICVDQCLTSTTNCSTDKKCNDYYNSLSCPHGGYCRQGQNPKTCHYNAPHSGGGPVTKTCTHDIQCGCTNDSCNLHGGACHKTLPDSSCSNPPCCPKTPPGAGGTCGGKDKKPCPGSGTGGRPRAFCGGNGYCKKCFDEKGKTLTQPCEPKEEYTDNRSLWSAWAPSKSAPEQSASTAVFSNYYTSVGSSWNGANLIGVKGDMGAALCPYGSYYDSSKTQYGQCVEHKPVCPEQEKAMMGFCDKPYVEAKYVHKGEKIDVYVGNGETKQLPLPEITLTWYALVGAAQYQENVAISYIDTVLSFCQSAGISRLAFPFIVPDLKNYASYMLMDPNSKELPVEGDALAQVNNALSWLVKYLLTPAKNKNIAIGLNVYASYKDARWKEWWQGSKTPACYTDNCNSTNESDCNKTADCTWTQTGPNSYACLPKEKFTTGPTPMTPDPCSNTSPSTCCSTASCSWPYIATFIKLLNAKAGDKVQKVTFLQVDQEWCHCGDISNNIFCVREVLGSGFEFTIATSLGTPPTNTSYSVPEVYWDAGNQFPCTGGPGTYQYLTPPCTDWTSHKKLRNQPKAFYDLIAGDGQHLGSDNKGTGDTQNAWLGRGKFNTTVTDLQKSGVHIIPSFSIENLSMCSYDEKGNPMEMKLTGDPKSGTARWECSKTI